MKQPQCLYNEFLSPYIDGALSPDQHRLVSEHLAGCSSCRAEHQALLELTQMLRQLPAEPLPEGFSDRLHQRLLQEQKTRRRSVYAKSIRFCSAAAAAVLLAVLLNGGYFDRLLNPKYAYVSDLDLSAGQDAAEPKTRAEFTDGINEAAAGQAPDLPAHQDAAADRSTASAPAYRQRQRQIYASTINETPPAHEAAAAENNTAEAPSPDLQADGTGAAPEALPSAPPAPEEAVFFSAPAPSPTMDAASDAAFKGTGASPEQGAGGAAQAGGASVQSAPAASEAPKRIVDDISRRSLHNISGASSHDGEDAFYVKVHATVVDLSIIKDRLIQSYPGEYAEGRISLKLSHEQFKAVMDVLARHNAVVIQDEETGSLDANLCVITQRK